MSLVLGLEITPRFVRGAFLKTALRGSEMEHYAEVAIAPPSEEQSTTAPLRAAVAEVLAQGSRPPDRVIAALDGELASLRLIDLPLGVEKKIAEVLPGELESLLPFEVSDAIVDYQIVSRDEINLQLMTVATPRENVAERLQLLRAAGVDPRELAVGAASLFSLFLLVGAASAQPYEHVVVTADSFAPHIAPLLPASGENLEALLAQQDLRHQRRQREIIGIVDRRVELLR